MLTILKPDEFSREVLELSRSSETPILDCILEICQARDIDLMMVPSLLTRELKELLHSEAESLNLLTRTSPVE